MFECKFMTDNDAFAESREQEVCRILREIADQIERGVSDKFQTILDANGNSVGRFKLTQRV